MKDGGTRDLHALFDAQRVAFDADRYPDAASRRDRLRRLHALTTENESSWVEAIAQDFGQRSPHETRLAECYIVASAARHAMRHVAQWMAARVVATPLHLLPARAMLMPQPVGVVGVISPWNYPLQLALGPVVGALAAGNRVLLKPSELTPTLSAMLAYKVPQYFREDELAVVEGDAQTGAAFSALPFDHLFFTGSTAVGRHIARAAAENLTPTTLELGGKSPALFDHDANLGLAALRLMTGKLLNAGQTCIAPDYAMVPSRNLAAFVDAVRAAVTKLYPSITANPDYSSIVNERHYARLCGLVEDARAKGAEVHVLGTNDPRLRKLAPALITRVNDGIRVMQEEIFGPLLPIETYDELNEAIERIHARPRPLAFYLFGDDPVRRRHVLERTTAGGVTVNDTMWHFAHEGLPFGGVGASGIGAYHGERGFRTFSHDKPIFVQRRIAFTALLQPPYGTGFERLLSILRRLNT